MKKAVILALIIVTALLVGTAAAQPPENYVSVSTILELPEFIPGVGALYIDPANAPVGPWLAYNQDNSQLIEILFMIPVSEMDAHQDWSGLAAGLLASLDAGMVDHVDVTYNGGHPGMAEPHYHFRLALVDHATQEAALSAQ